MPVSKRSSCEGTFPGLANCGAAWHPRAANTSKPGQLSCPLSRKDAPWRICMELSVGKRQARISAPGSRSSLESSLTCIHCTKAYTDTNTSYHHPPPSFPRQLLRVLCCAPTARRNPYNPIVLRLKSHLAGVHTKSVGNPALSLPIRSQAPE